MVFTISQSSVDINFQFRRDKDLIIGVVWIESSVVGHQYLQSLYEYGPVFYISLASTVPLFHRQISKQWLPYVCSGPELPSVPAFHPPYFAVWHTVYTWDCTKNVRVILNLHLFRGFL